MTEILEICCELSCVSSKKLDQEMKRFAETALDKFKTSFSEASDVDEDHRYELNIDYEITHYAKQTAAIKFNTYELKAE